MLPAQAWRRVHRRCIPRCRSYLLRKDSVQRAAGYQPLEGDVQWTSRSTLLYPALCTFAGLCAGVFGVGGGIIKVGLHELGARGVAQPLGRKGVCTTAGLQGGLHNR